MNKRTMIWILAIIVLAGLVLKVPVSPKYGEMRTNREVEFKVFGVADKIKVDDSLEFVSPIEKEKPFVLDLDPGTYYWKADNSFLIGKFTIVSEVNVKLEKLKERYRISNLGNTEIDLDVKKNGLLTGAVILGLNDKTDLQLQNNSVVVASQR